MFSNQLYESDEQMQKRLNELQVRKQIELSNEVAKANFRNDSRMELERRKMCLQEYKRQLRAVSYTEVSLKEDGTIEAKEKNAIVNLPKIPISNFSFEAIANLVSSDGECGIYGLELIIDNKQVQIFLNAHKMGRPEYFMKKITEVGGRIFADTNKKSRNIIIGLWSELRKQCKDTVVVPTHIGWITDKQERYRFVEEGRMLWSDVIKRAK